VKGRRCASRPVEQEQSDSVLDACSDEAEVLDGGYGRHRSIEFRYGSNHSASSSARARGFRVLTSSSMATGTLGHGPWPRMRERSGVAPAAHLRRHPELVDVADLAVELVRPEGDEQGVARTMPAIWTRRVPMSSWDGPCHFGLSSSSWRAAGVPRKRRGEGPAWTAGRAASSSSMASLAAPPRVRLASAEAWTGSRYIARAADLFDGALEPRDLDRVGTQ